jgi:hypothetical protein
MPRPSRFRLRSRKRALWRAWRGSGTMARWMVGATGIEPVDLSGCSPIPGLSALTDRRSAIWDHRGGHPVWRADGVLRGWSASGPGSGSARTVIPPGCAPGRTRAGTARRRSRHPSPPPASTVSTLRWSRSAAASRCLVSAPESATARRTPPETAGPTAATRQGRWRRAADRRRRICRHGPRSGGQLAVVQPVGAPVRGGLDRLARVVRPVFQRTLDDDIDVGLEQRVGRVGSRQALTRRAAGAHRHIDPDAEAALRDAELISDP